MRLVTLLVVIGLAISGCGYKGPLTLPDKPTQPLPDKATPQTQQQKQDDK
jgi:predicted small lipoprotein YifL